MTPLVLFTLAWAAGMVFFQAVQPPGVWLLAPVPAALVLLVGWGNHRWGRRGAAMLLALSLGGARYLLAHSSIGADHIGFYRDAGTVTLQGVVIAEPDDRTHDTRLRVRTEAVTLPEGQHFEVEGPVLVYAPLYTGVRYGDVISATGELSTPPVFATFSYRDYLARQGILVLLRHAQLDILASHQANPILDMLLRFKRHAHGVLLKVLPEPQASLLSGILLGIERGIPARLMDDFNRTGTSHVIAISGFNLTLVAGFLAGLAHRYLPRRGKLLLALAGVWLYVILVGAAAAVLRAGAMASLVVLARHEQRPIHGPTSLAAAVFLLSLWQPTILWDLGFQLSFAATLGLMLYVEPLSAWFIGRLAAFTGEDRARQIVASVSEVFIVTVAVQITTLGIIVHHTQQLSLVTLLTNVLILPAQIFVMAFGALALAAGVVFLPAGRVLGWLAWVFLTWTIRMVTWTATFPAAAISLERVPDGFVWSYYGLLIIATVMLKWWGGHTRDERRQLGARIRAFLKRGPALFTGPYRWPLVTGTSAIVLIVLFLFSRPDGRLHVWFLDAGHGDAVFVRTPSGRQILIDGGPDPQRMLAALGRVMPFWSRELDLVVLTSPDPERLAGLIPVLERFDVDSVALSPEAGQGAYFAEWTTRLEDRPADSYGITVAGDTWMLDSEVALHILWPRADEVGPLVLALVHDDVRMLLPGDATPTVEAGLSDAWRDGLQSHVLLLPRHGDKTSASAPFLQAVQPDVAIVTLAEDEVPSSFVLARLMETPLYRTNTHGTIEIVSNGRRVRVKTER